MSKEEFHLLKSSLKAIKDDFIFPKGDSIFEALISTSLWGTKHHQNVIFTKNQSNFYLHVPRHQSKRSVSK